MTLSRRIFELWEAIRACDPPIDVFQNKDEPRMQMLAEYARVEASLATKTDNSHLAIMLALRSMAVQRHELSDLISESELVLTQPKVTSTSARPTLYVIREMIESARIEIILAGYRITNNTILEMLHQAARRQVRVEVLCGRLDCDAIRILDTWPVDVPPPVLYQDLEHSPELNSLMHVKALLIDSTQLLISSANFTYSGMSRNIEFGIRATGQAALEAKTVLAQLMKSQLCERVDPRNAMPAAQTGHPLVTNDSGA